VGAMAAQLHFLFTSAPIDNFGLNLQLNFTESGQILGRRSTSGPVPRGQNSSGNRPIRLGGASETAGQC